MLLANCAEYGVASVGNAKLITVSTNFKHTTTRLHNNSMWHRQGVCLYSKTAPLPTSSREPKPGK